MSDIKVFKLVVVGCAGVGKSCYINKYKTGEFLKSYTPTVGVDSGKTISLSTNNGTVSFVCWDFAGQEINSKSDEALIGADAAIIMFDVTSRLTYNKVESFHKKIKKVCGDIPMVLCGNKVDCRMRIVSPTQINVHRKLGMYYCDLSVKSNYNFEKPFLALLKKLVKDDTILLTEGK